jgi:hypothetical protein
MVTGRWSSPRRNDLYTDFTDDFTEKTFFHREGRKEREEIHEDFEGLSEKS